MVVLKNTWLSLKSFYWVVFVILFLLWVGGTLWRVGQQPVRCLLGGGELGDRLGALVPSETACLASSPGRMSLTAVWISLEEMVDLLL